MAFLPFKIPFLLPATKPVSDPQLASTEEEVESTQNSTQVSTDVPAVATTFSRPIPLKDVTTNVTSQSIKPKKKNPIVSTFVVNTTKKATTFAYKKVNSSSAFISFKLAMVDFFEHLFRLAFTITTKIVFLLRDLLINTLNILYSAVLIPLDLILIVAHSTWLHFAYRILDKKRTKLTEQDPSIIPKEEEKRRIQRQNQELADLTTTRTLFWSGKPLSIRSYFLDFMGSRINDDDNDVEGSPFIKESIIPSQLFPRHLGLDNGEIPSQINSSINPVQSSVELELNHNPARDNLTEGFKHFDSSKRQLGITQYTKFSDQLYKRRLQELPRKPLDNYRRLSQNVNTINERGQTEDALTDQEFSYEVPLFVENSGDQSLMHNSKATPSAYYKSVEPLNISQHKGFRRTGLPTVKPGTRHMSLSSMPPESKLTGDVIVKERSEADVRRPSTMQFGSGVGPSRSLSEAAAAKKKFNVNNAADEILKFSNDFKKLMSETPISPPILPSRGDESSGIDPRKQIFLPKIDMVVEEKGNDELKASESQEPTAQEEKEQKNKQIHKAIEAANNISISGTRSFYNTNNSQAVSSSTGPLDASGKGLWNNLASKMFVKTTEVAPKPNPRPRLPTLESEISMNSSVSVTDSDVGESKVKKKEEISGRKKHRRWFGEPRWVHQLADESSDDYGDVLTTGTEDNNEVETDEGKAIGAAVLSARKKREKTGGDGRTGVLREAAIKKQQHRSKVGDAAAYEEVPAVHKDQPIRWTNNQDLGTLQLPHLGVSANSSMVDLEASSGGGRLRLHSAHEYLNTEAQATVEPKQRTANEYSMLEVPILSGVVARSPDFLSMSATAITLSPEETTGRLALGHLSEDHIDSAATITLPTATAATTGEENENGDGMTRVRGAHMKLYGRRLANKLKRRAQRKEGVDESEGGGSAVESSATMLANELIEGSSGNNIETTGGESAWVDEESDAVSIEV